MSLTRRSALALAGAAWAGPAFAQSPAFPKAPVRIIVPFAPGGATDTVARVIAEGLQQTWGQTVIVDYRPGADTVVGVDFVARSAPDGYTMGLVNSSFAINPSLRKLHYDTLKDLRGVTQIGFIQTALVARADAPFSTVKEMIAYAKQHPGKLNYGNSGIGGLSYLALELMKRQEGFDMLNVSFKGGGQVMTELMAGRIDIASEPFLVVLPHVNAGKVKMLGTFGAKRVHGYEDRFPTISESVPGLSAASLLGLLVPAATPGAVVHKISADTAELLSRPAVRQRLEEMGVEAVGGTPEAFDALIRSEMNRWGKVVSDAHIVLE